MKKRIYCVKCKKKHEVSAKKVTLKNKRKAYKGKCPKYGHAIYKITK